MATYTPLKHEEMSSTMVNPADGIMDDRHLMTIIILALSSRLLPNLSLAQMLTRRLLHMRHARPHRCHSFPRHRQRLLLVSRKAAGDLAQLLVALRGGRQPFAGLIHDATQAAAVNHVTLQSVFHSGYCMSRMSDVRPKRTSIA